MAQKSNLITIRQNNFFNLITLNSKIWISLYNFINSLKRLFNVKNILVHNFFLGFDNSVLHLKFSIFYQNLKLSYYKNRIIKSSSITNSFKFIKEKVLSKLFFQYQQEYRINTIILKISILNRIINKSFLTYFRFALKHFNTLFVRRFNLFIDFIKIIVLFVERSINANLFVFFLARLFKFLSKRAHTRFLVFVKDLMNSIINFNSNFDIKGFKFLINGKIRGKDRASSKLIQIGKLPMQSISKNVEFSFSHVYTIYGAFGFKLWVYRQNKSI
jgi:hypothetical protein